MGKMVGKDGLSLITEPGPETSDGGNEEWYELVVVVSSLDLTELSIELGPGEAVRENACVFSLDAVKASGVVTVAGRINLGAVGAALSRVSITIKVEGLQLSDEGVNVIEVEADASEAR